MSIKLSQQQKRPPWLTRSIFLWGTGAIVGLGIAIALIAALATGKLKAGIGGGKIEVTSVKTTVGAVETTTTTTPQEAKTLWDWLNLMGVLAVPITLAILAAWLQHKQQERELKIAEDNRQEEALQHYLDRVSNLLIEKNLLAIAAKKTRSPEETELLDVSVNIIRVLTLSTLRRLSNGNRKASVVRLLSEAGITRRLGVRLRDADLSNANLVSVNLVRADLIRANLNQANLRGAYLNQAKLRGANLNGADLTGAYLNGADLSKPFFRHEGKAVRSVDLRGANLEGAYLNGANLKDTNLEGAKGLTKEQLEKAYLCRTQLPEGIDIVSLDRDCGTDYNTWLKKPPDTSTQIQQQP